jgi:hypothetical protein
MISKVFLGTILLLGGIITILMAPKLEGTILRSYKLGIILVMLGTYVIWKTIKDLREKQKERRELKNTKE